MISFLGIKKDTPISIRERLAIKDDIGALEKLRSIFKEVVIISTCNRTEIYFNGFTDRVEILKEIFELLGWDESLTRWVFIKNGRDTVRHLFEVSCGYHSKIMGEDQILGQIKDAYSSAKAISAVGGELERMFQQAVTCGKRFRREAKLYEIPVSSVSIAVNDIADKECKSVMVIGYGAIGRLAVKYLLSHKVENIYVAVRNPQKLNAFKEENITLINTKEKDKHINNVDAIICCTSSPYTVIEKEDIINVNHDLYIYDMAVPRDVSEEVLSVDGVTLLNIDDISRMDDRNRSIRADKMKENRYITEKYIEEYMEWLDNRGISKVISEMKKKEKEVFEKRAITYRNKSKDKSDRELVEMLLKSTSSAYVNRAIEVLKEEWAEGGEECLRIIKKIFLEEV